MNTINWLLVALGAIIIVTGILLYRWFRRKFVKMDGFEGFVEERGSFPRRKDFDWVKSDINRLEKEASNTPHVGK